MWPWSSREQSYPYSPIRQSNGEDAEPSRSYRPSDEADLESGYHKEGMLSTVRTYAGHYVGRARRQRRPLLVVSSLGAVLCFSALIIFSFTIYDRFLPPRVPDYGDVGVVGSDAIGADDAVFNTSDGILPIPDDPTHILVPTRNPHRKPVPLLKPYETRPPLDMLTEYFMTGDIKQHDPSAHPTPQMDLVYMFVNASSDYFMEGKDAKMVEEGFQASTKGHGHHFRDNGELRGAVRSGALAFGDRVRDIHLITGSFEIPEASRHIIPSEDELARLGVNTSDITGWKVGQVPEWLDYEHRANLKYHVHSDIYHLPRDDDGRVPPVIEDEDEDKWRALSLPTFNSFEIECRVGWVEGLAENL
jgi:3-O-alpha-D-mannopyranosyl-alpha-D-mannopyranose xylosylphosphotransferase